MPAQAIQFSPKAEEIIELVRFLDQEPREAAQRIKELENHVEGLNKEIADIEERYDELEKKTLQDDVEDAVNKLLDLVERPTGSLRACLPQTAASERALIALFDAIGRKL